MAQVWYVAETICPDCSRFAGGWSVVPLPQVKFGEDAFEFCFYHSRRFRDGNTVRRARKAGYAAGYAVRSPSLCFFKVRAPYWPVSDVPVWKWNAAVSTIYDNDGHNLA